MGWFRGIRRIPLLAELDLPDPERLPPVSVVVAARNEERVVGETIPSLLAQDYGGEAEVVAVDDRSTDGTGAELARLASAHPRLEVLRVDELPDGWLGKTHAQGLGAEAATGDWIVFTDADVRFAPGTVRRAVAFAEARGLDHLVLLPEVVSEGPLLRGFVGAFSGLFLVALRPWLAGDLESKASVGVGAFQMVRREVYRAIGGHRPISLRPDDDVRLGALIKGRGFRQDVAFGTGLVRVRWHETVGGAVRGLEKSIFPGMDYRPGATVLAALVLVLTNVVPFVAVFFRGRLRPLHALNAATVLGFYAVQGRYTGAKLPALSYWALHPVSAGLLAYAALRSVYKILRRGGVEWRGTFYPLEELKKNRA